MKPRLRPRASVGHVLGGQVVWEYVGLATTRQTSTTFPIRQAHCCHITGRQVLFRVSSFSSLFTFFRQSLVSVVDRHVHATNRQENRCIPEVLQCQNFTQPVFGIVAPRVSLSSGKSRRSSHPSGIARISRLSLRVGRKEIIRRRDDKTQRGALLLG